MDVAIKMVIQRLNGGPIALSSPESVKRSRILVKLSESKEDNEDDADRVISVREEETITSDEESESFADEILEVDNLEVDKATTDDEDGDEKDELDVSMEDDDDDEDDEGNDEGDEGKRSSAHPYLS